jgi:hypothetical protein
MNREGAKQGRVTAAVAAVAAEFGIAAFAAFAAVKLRLGFRG